MWSFSSNNHPFSLSQKVILTSPGGIPFAYTDVSGHDAIDRFPKQRQARGRNNDGIPMTADFFRNLQEAALGIFFEVEKEFFAFNLHAFAK